MFSCTTATKLKIPLLHHITPNTKSEEKTIFTELDKHSSIC